ncbi:MAG: hypothetical protein ABI579_06405 [Candidatus Sumerlaeota bacterium]
MTGDKMMKSILLTITATVALAFNTQGAFAQRSQLMPPPETSYNSGAQSVDPVSSGNARHAVPAHVSGQEGIYSDSPWGIASTRRGDPAFHGLMEGLQEASKKATQQLINVPPADKQAIDDQISDLTAHNAKSIIIDAPNAEDVSRVVANSKFLQINIVVLTDAVPEAGFKNVPLIVLSPADYGIVGAEAAMDALKDTKNGRVIFLVSGPAEDATRAAFTDAFQGKNKYEVVEATEDKKLTESETPTAIVALTPSDTSRLQTYLGDLPGSSVIGTGDTIGVKQVYDNGVLRYRLRADYEKIFAECQRVIGNPPGEPVHLKPFLDKSTKPRPGPPGAPAPPR